MKGTWHTALGYVAKRVGVVGIAATAVTLGLSGLPRDLGVDIGTWVDDAEAQQAQGQNAQIGGAGKGGRPEGGSPGTDQRGVRGGQPGVTLEDEVFRGGKRTVDPAAEEADEDSDRPDWAGGNPDLNPHRPTDVGRPEDPGQQPTDPGGGKPVDSGKPELVKGDEYGDLFVYVRDPVTGAPILTIENDVNGNEACDTDDTCYYQVYVCEDEDCTETRIERLYLVWDEGSEKWAAELPDGVTSVEVEFGRASSVRAPDRVTDHALDEVVKKLDEAAIYDADGNVTALNVTVDDAGRLVINGATVDSPLENAALYIALLEDEDNPLQPFVEKLLETLNVSKLDLAASALAGSADKTGDITVDFVIYQNAIIDVTNSEFTLVPEDGVPNNGDQTITFEYFDYSDVTYDRTKYDYEVSYYYTPDGGTTVIQSNVNLMDYLDTTNSVDVSSLDGATLFTVQSDDALEIIELMHTQIHDGPLPGDTIVGTTPMPPDLPGVPLVVE